MGQVLSFTPFLNKLQKFSELRQAAWNQNAGHITALFCGLDIAYYIFQWYFSIIRTCNVGTNLRQNSLMLEQTTHPFMRINIYFMLNANKFKCLQQHTPCKTPKCNTITVSPYERLTIHGLGWWPDKMVADKMVRTKWYGQTGIRTKWYWTKWYGQNGTDKTVWIRL